MWVLNSRHYDDQFYTDPKLWPEERKQLHEAMLTQAMNRRARHILFLLKSYTPNQTIARLKHHNVHWRGQTTLNQGEKLHLVNKAGVHRFRVAGNTSAGITSLCVALTHGANAVQLCGFSFSDSYAYLSSVPNGTRRHISEDQEALSDLCKKHRFTLSYNNPDPAIS